MVDVVNSKSRISIILRIASFIMVLGTGLVVLSFANFDLQALQELMQDTHPLNFIGIMCLLPLAGFPISIFYLYAGSVFPWWQATLYCSLSLAVNMGIAYPIARHFLATPLNQILAIYSKNIPKLTEKNQFRITFLVRSVPGVPFFLQNYLLAFLGVRFGPYLIISWSIQSVFAAGMAALPKTVERAGWITMALVVSVFLLLGVFHRVFTGKSLTNQDPPKI